MNMNPPCPNQMKLLEERLQKGKEAAAQLQTLLQKPLDNHGSVSAAQLAVQILRSFTDSLSVLEPNEIFQIVAADGPTRACSSNRSSKTTVGQKKKPGGGGVKERRGSYKRRNVSDSWIKLSSNKEDEYAWRKYGQKEILNSKFPRCYFRCTHKHDQGCKATKQVQRVEQDTLLYRTTYFGLHTCRTDMLRVPPKIIQETITAPVDSSCLLRFDDEAKNINNIIPSSKKRSGGGVLPDVILVNELDTLSDMSDNKSLSLDSSNIWLQELMTTTTISAGGTSSVQPAPPKAVTADAHRHYLDDEEGVDVSCSVVYSCSSNSTTLPNFDHDMEAAAAFSDHDQFSDLDNDFYVGFEKGDEYFQARSLTD